MSAPTEPMTQDEAIASIGQYNYGWHDSDAAGLSARRGVDESVVRNISVSSKRCRSARKHSSAGVSPVLFRHKMRAKRPYYKKSYHNQIKKILQWQI
jgi:hypothetical protein